MKAKGDSKLYQAQAAKSQTRFSALTSTLLSCLIILCWLGHLLFSVYTVSFETWAWPLHVLVQSFFSVGLFIVAHDAMHCLAVPGSNKWNDLVGSICTFLYAGFSYSELKKNHLAHHRAPATLDDPDYSSSGNENFWVWLFSFSTKYFGLKEFAKLHIHVALLYVLGGSFTKVVILFAVPSWISALQLFYFGTYLPHRATNGANYDRHKSRSNDFPTWLSLLTCFHFGYHYEHHLFPYLSWWQLPAAYKVRKKGASNVDR